jgi:hypothetical protein
MLYVVVACLAVSAWLCAIAMRSSDRFRSPRMLICIAAVFMINTVLLPQFVPLQLQCVFLAIVWLVHRRWPLRRFAAVVLFATLLPYALVATGGYLVTRGVLDRHPFESLEGRLPSRSFEPVRMSEAALDSYEEENSVGSGIRDAALRQLHEDTLATFVQRFGFGASRMIGFDHLLREGTPRPPKQPQPGHLALSAAVDHEELKPSTASEKPIREMHSFCYEDFFTPRRFGYFVDRRHVAGFEPHGIHRERGAQREYSQVRVRTVDLVGLVLHVEPVVYVSNDLPDMKNIASIPRRPLDVFEKQGLDSLRNGDPLFVRATPNGLRVLGPIRAVSQCTKCHDCERGTLLGAFSYRTDGSPMLPVVPAERPQPRVRQILEGPLPLHPPQ